eukprot:CFRG2399T1
MDIQEKQKLVHQSIEAGEGFVKVYYKAFDVERHKLSNYFHEDASLIWNGTPIQGRKQIQEFLNDNIPSTRHKIISVDSQAAPATTGVEGTALVTVSGVVKYQTEDVELPFGETFIMVPKPGSATYFVMSDNFRCLVP